MILNNFFSVPIEHPTEEIFEPIFDRPGLRVERIISTGQTTPAGEWYDQAQDEWVLLLQGEAILSYADGTQQQLKPGDSVFLPAHHPHRVAYTSSEPPCIWLAIHGDLRSDCH